MYYPENCKLFISLLPLNIHHIGSCPALSIQILSKYVQYLKVKNDKNLGAIEKKHVYTGCPKKSEMLNFHYFDIRNIAYFDFIR